MTCPCEGCKHERAEARDRAKARAAFRKAKAALGARQAAAEDAL